MLLLAFLFFFSNCRAQIFDRFWPLAQEVDGHLTANFRNVSEAVLLVGGSGTGKTSLAMLLAADPSLRTERSSSGMLLSDDGRKIGRPTILPNFMRDKETGVVLVDCPSPTEPEEAVAAAEYAIMKTVSLLSRVKILVVENVYSLLEGGDKEGLMRVKRLLGQYGDVAAVVASKSDISGTAYGKKVNAQVVEFPRPFRPGSPLDTLQETTNSIRKILSYVDFGELKLRPSERMTCFLNKVASKLSTEISDAFAKLIATARVNGLQSVESATNRHNAAAALAARMSTLQSLNYSDLVASLKDFNASSERFDSLAKQLDWMHDAGIEIKIPRDEINSTLGRVIKEFDKLHRFYEFLNDTRATLREYKYLKNRGRLADEVLEDFTTFDSLVMSLAAIDLQSRPQLLGLPLLDWMKHDLDAVFSDTLKFDDWSVENGIVAAAPFLLLSEVVKKYEGRNKPIVMMASQIIFLDQNLKLQNGENLIMISPEVQVVQKNLTVELKGVEGWSRVDAPLRGDGQAGGPGGNSGNFFIFCTKLRGAENLLVRSEGGDGGKGQEGAPAMQGVLQAEAAVDVFEPTQNVSFANMSSGNIQLQYIEKRFDPVPAGAGGVGGKGGYAGSVLIYISGGEAMGVRVESKRGADGEDGPGGKGAPAEAKFTFILSECEEEDECQKIAAGQSVEMISPLEQGTAGKSAVEAEKATKPPPFVIRPYLYLYVGTILSKNLAPEVEKEVVQLVQRLPDLIREQGGQMDGGLEQLEAEWAVMEKEKEEMQQTLGRHLPLMHHLLLAYAEQAPGGRQLSELIKQKSQN